MKRTFSIPLAVTVFSIVLGFTNCKKEQAGRINNSATGNNGSNTFTSLSATMEDRIDAIVKDLAQSDYSLSFDKPIPTSGITKTSYGATSYVVYADPQDLICGDPIFKKYQKYMPIWKLPQFIVPTCPDMIPFPHEFEKINELLQKANPAQFKGLQGIKLAGGGILMANETFTRQYASLKADKIDEIIKGLNPEKFILFGDPAKSNGFFTRNAYGFANVNDIVLKPYKKTLKDLIPRPILIGCFDPEILAVIKEGFQKINPATYKGLGVNPIDETRNIATLSMQY
ncbi:MAG: hypothetical protein ABIN89_25035 [Chitinophagaceae bacterium]